MHIKLTRTICCLLAALMLAGVMASPAMADSEREARRQRHEMHRLRLQLEAAQQQKDALTSQAGDLKKQLDGLQAKYAALEKKSKLQRRQIDALTAKNEDAGKRLQDMTEQNAETGKALQQTQAAKKQVEGNLQVCTNKNTRLYKLSVDLMHKYQSKGVMAALLQKEPFTGLEQVKIENLLQDYQDKAEANKVKSAANEGSQAPQL